MGLKYILPLIALSFFGCSSETPTEENEPEIIHELGVDPPALVPMAQTVKQMPGTLTLGSNINLMVSSEGDMNLYNDAEYLQSLLLDEFGLPTKLNSPMVAPSFIRLSLVEGDTLSEGYELVVNEEGLEILSASKPGLMRGMQTLRQLLHLAERDAKKDFVLNCVEIKDDPKFKHRGLLLDCCRHFYPVETVKKYIDLLAYFKMNVLHWHLTEDQGWRIESETYPKLNEISSWRTEQDGSTYGGFYTKKEIKEIVAYASERYVTVIPEIELPGHAQAALAAYPEHSCVGSGIKVANDWGVFKEIYCAGDDETFVFLENILAEVLALFPSTYIHIGGDEAPKIRWEECSKCQKRIADEGLRDEHELQSYFIQRIEKFLNANGRQLIGWDEILEGGLSPNAAVQSWRGMDGGKTAAMANHEVIMSPTSHCYFDYPLKAIDLEKVYSFDPIPEDLDKDKVKYVIGGECNMWTEHVPDVANLDSKVFPRLLAMAEVLWTYPEKRNFTMFQQRVQNHYPFLTKKKVAYGDETIPCTINVLPEEGAISIEIIPGSSDLSIWYKWDDASFQEYTGPFDLKNTGDLFVHAKKGEDNYGAMLAQVFKDSKALGRKSIFTDQPSQSYASRGEFGLTDGALGSLDYKDGNWMGFQSDLDAVIDLGEIKSIDYMGANFYQYTNSWIFCPTIVIFEYSLDGEEWHHFYKGACEVRPKDRGNLIGTVEFVREKKFEMRYIRIKAKNIGEVPAWHESAGSKAWLFIDEVTVE